MRTDPRRLKRPRPGACLLAGGLLLACIAVLPGEEGRDGVDSILQARMAAAELTSEGRLEQAEVLLQDLVQRSGIHLGPMHPETLRCRESLGIALLSDHRPVDAEAELHPVLEARSAALGPGHPETIRAGYLLALALRWQGRFAEALEFADGAYLAARARFGEGAPRTRLYASLWRDLMARKLASVDLD